MKKLKIYIDTSVIGGCFDEEFSPWSKSLFEDFKNKMFIPVISDVITYEINYAPKRVKDKYAELFSYGIVELEVTDEVEELADICIKKDCNSRI